MKRLLTKATLLCLPCLAVQNLLAAEILSHDQNRLAALLGWIVNPNTPCGGYYRNLMAPEEKPSQTTPITISAAQSTLYLNGSSLLQGDVWLTQAGRRLQADQARLYRSPGNGKLDTVDLSGHVAATEQGKLIKAEQAHVQFAPRLAILKNSVYRMALEPGDATPASVLTAWGQAQTIEQQGSQQLRLSDATYTTCSPLASLWKLQARKIDLNQATGRGVARDVRLKIKDIPIFYIPYFNFPIDKRRQTGFLFPSYGSTSTGGVDISVPYYWNLAPNYDLLFTPHLYTKRGVQWNGEFRYLTQRDNGDLTVSLLPHDRAFVQFQREAMQQFSGDPSLDRLESASADRWLLTWRHHIQWDPHWWGAINYNALSDDYYLQDFGNISAVIAPNQLLRQANINYANEHWNFLGRLQSYQTLHPVNDGITLNQYSTLPLLQLSGNYPGQQKIGSFWDSEYVHFTRRRNPGEISLPAIGDRIHIQPGFNLPLRWQAGYVTPRVQLASTHYWIGHQSDDFATVIQRTLPIMDVDSGLYFERYLHLIGSDYQQILEPRLYYLYVPFHKQDDIPVFDSAIQPFSFDQLFVSNRFSGKDRIGDANQMTLALQTRLLDMASGQEKVRASLGQIYYFTDRKVTLAQGEPDPITNVGSTSPTETSSPIAGQLNYYLNPAWSALANVAWDPHNSQLNTGNVNLQYRPEPGSIINLGYNFVRYGDATIFQPGTIIPQATAQNNLSQGIFSWAWPIKENWHIVGSFNYNLSQQYPQTYFYGFEYDNCCWAVRLVSGRTLSSLNQNNNPVFNNIVYLQWQLKGLGNLGTGDPMSLLSNGILGYRDSFGEI